MDFYQNLYGLLQKDFLDFCQIYSWILWISSRDVRLDYYEKDYGIMIEAFEFLNWLKEKNKRM